jgi:hypothetical protein
MCTFRRCVDRRLFDLWEEVLSITTSLELTTEEDELVWEYNFSGLYSSQSLYAITNFRGATPIYVPTVWMLMVPPRVHFFLWLLSKNKLLTRDNLYKRREVEDKTCLFCGEHETVYHLFYECVVAKQAWNVVSEVIGFQIGYDFESIAKCWLCNNNLV